MSVRKIAISIPENVLRQVDRSAKRAKTTRSGFISRVLTAVSHAGTQIEITERINQLFSEEGISEEQTQVSDIYLQAAEKSFKDSKW